MVSGVGDGDCSGGTGRVRVPCDRSPCRQGTSQRHFPAPDLSRTTCTITCRAELQAGAGRGLCIAKHWQKPAHLHVQAVMGGVISKSLSHNPFVPIYLLFQRSKLKNLVSIILLPTWETFQLGHFVIWVLHICPGFRFPFGKGRGSK